MRKAILNFAEENNDSLGWASTLFLALTGALSITATAAPEHAPLPFSIAGPVFLLNLMLAGIFYLSAKR